jgi:hypothetical protein
MTMNLKRKGTDFNTSLVEEEDRGWFETKARLANDSSFQFDWKSRFQAVQAEFDLSQKRQALYDSASALQASLQSQIQEAREACAEESQDLYRLVESIRQLELEAQQLQTSVSESKTLQTQLLQQISTLRKEASQHLEELDEVELERLQQVPKIKNQISLYAKTTGIKWDYDRETILAGEVVRTYKEFGFIPLIFILQESSDLLHSVPYRLFHPWISSLASRLILENTMPSRLPIICGLQWREMSIPPSRQLRGVSHFVLSKDGACTRLGDSESLRRLSSWSSIISLY